MPVQRATVVGAGIMGHGIALVLARGGCQVTMSDVADDILERAQKKISDTLRVFIRHELVSPEEVGQLQKRIGATTDLAKATRDTDFVIEAVTEDIELKRELFARLDTLCPSRTILASNTSSLPIGKMASATGRPDRVVGTHFVMPPHIMPLVEVVRGEKTSDDTVKTTCQLMEKAGKTPVIINKDVPGFVHNRLQTALNREAIAILQAEVASARDIDIVVTQGFGLRYSTTGPMEQQDMAGLNVHFMVATYLHPYLDTSTEPHLYFKRLVDSGHLGIKTGKGFYDWTGKDTDAMLRAQEEDLIESVKNASRRWKARE
ncbi:3-hydroxyacyl-CoA dehydrogenase family protein [Chloroflexota bacterium]